MILTAVCTEAVRDTNQYDAALAGLSAARRERIARLRLDSDRRLSVCAGLALDACLAAVGLRERDEPIARSEHGKPYLLRHPDRQYSLSHSGVWAVCVLDSAPVGVDIQQHRTADYDALARRWFTTEEAAFLAALSESDRAAAFFRLWTAKESYLKAEGCGLADGGLSRVSLLHGAPSPWRLREYPLAGYALTVCGQGTFADVISFYDSVPLR